MNIITSMLSSSFKVELGNSFFFFFFRSLMNITPILRSSPSIIILMSLFFIKITNLYLSNAQQILLIGLLYRLTPHLSCMDSLNPLPLHYFRDFNSSIYRVFSYTPPNQILQNYLLNSIIFGHQTFDKQSWTRTKVGPFTYHIR